MKITYPELLVLGVVVLALVWYVWNFIAADLPDDFIEKTRKKNKASSD